MGKRFVVSTPKPWSDGSGKTWWLRVGSAWQNDQGLITVYLDSYPTPDKEGVIKMMLFDPPDKQEDIKPAPQGAAWQREMDDKVPF